MSRESVFKQVRAVQIPGSKLRASPRHWNCGMFRYGDRLWMSYRFHMDEPGTRCETAICQLDEKTLLPLTRGQHIKLSGEDRGLHHEDARLFIFRGQPHISYTEMSNYKPGVDYQCVMKYARLRLVGKMWTVDEEFHPKFGENFGQSKEKNWVFFEFEGELYCVYHGSPMHVVIKFKGDKKTGEWVTPAPYWSWGHIRGGTPPISLGESFLTIFHSSVRNMQGPHYARYFGAAYTFEAKPPFKPLMISRMPIMAGSEEDGHKVDPRYVDGWKPFVVFPAGCVSAGIADFLVSFGVNDWCCAVARIGMPDLQLVPADGSVVAPRFFTRSNGSTAVKLMNDAGMPTFFTWEVPRPGPGCTPGPGYMKVTDLRVAEEISEVDGVSELTEREYNALAGQRETAGRALR